MAWKYPGQDRIDMGLFGSRKIKISVHSESNINCFYYSQVKSKNKQCIDAIGKPTETSTYKKILSILDSKDKIPNLYRFVGNIAFL